MVRSRGIAIRGDQNAKKLHDAAGPVPEEGAHERLGCERVEPEYRLAGTWSMPLVSGREGDSRETWIGDSRAKASRAESGPASCAMTTTCLSQCPDLCLEELVLLVLCLLCLPSRVNGLFLGLNDLVCRGGSHILCDSATLFLPLSCSSTCLVCSRKDLLRPLITHEWNAYFPYVVLAVSCASCKLYSMSRTSCGHKITPSYR